MKNPMQAIGATKARGAVVIPGSYPAVPSWWPNRATRRAIKQGREQRLSPDYRGFLALNPNLRQHILTMR